MVEEYERETKHRIACTQIAGQQTMYVYCTFYSSYAAASANTANKEIYDE